MKPKITIAGHVTSEEIEQLLKEEQQRANIGRLLTEMKVTEISDQELEVKVVTSPPIRRVRRITGYLADTERFNSAKLSELNDRTNHI